MNGNKTIYPTRESFLVFGRPLIEQPEIDEVIASMKSGWLGSGPKVTEFEHMFAAYKGSSHAVALHSCTACLHLALIAAGIRPGDEVLVPTMTFASTVNAVVHVGATPVFVDCDRRTMNLDPNQLSRRVTPRTRAIIVVHFAGRPCDMDAVREIAARHSLVIIEDCAHAIETEYHGRTAGTLGDIGCFSFYVTKNIVTGEGGMAVTENQAYAETIRVMAQHGMSRDAWKRYRESGYAQYQVVYPGYNYHMMDLQAAMGIHQLPRVTRYWRRRTQIWNAYDAAFADVPVFTPPPDVPETTHAHHLYTLLLDVDRLGMSRDTFVQEMTRRRIGVGVHYVAVHLHPYYRNTWGHRRGEFPEAEWVSDRTVSLPLSPGLTDEDVADVIAAVRHTVGVS